jgi:ribosome modulation factor
MKQHTKLTPKQELIAEQQTQAQTAKEFCNADELLRFDATQTAVPAEIAGRLQKSCPQTLPPARSWWKNLLGR